MTPKLIGYWRIRQEGVKPYNPREMLKQVWDPVTKRFSVVKDLDFWRDDSDNKYPWPGDLVDPLFWTLHDKARTVAYLKAGHPCNWYRGISRCRLCEQMLGSHERTDGTWLWPDKYEHYIEAHDVIVPVDVMNHIEALNFVLPGKEAVEALLGDEVRGQEHWHMSHDESYWLGQQAIQRSTR